MENIQNEINGNYSDEMQELHDTDKYVSKAKENDISDRYYKLLMGLLKETAIKYNSDNIKIGVDAFKSNINHVKDRINDMKQEQKNLKNIIDIQEKQEQ